ncbi:MAG TPA: arsenate reductase ArsC [Bryobacteraceae bacterium]|nr:arsenate reductase ArsC [Bryobacteraceae bacterium]
MIKTKVLFLCTGNSCRTQMAEAMLRQIAGDRFEITSAGANPTTIDPDAIEAMQEIGIDISRQETKVVDPFLGSRFSYVISLCDRDRERTCPIFPGAIWRQQWPLDNPNAAHSPAERKALVRRLRDEIQQRVYEFASQH